MIIEFKLIYSIQLVSHSQSLQTSQLSWTYICRENMSHRLPPFYQRVVGIFAPSYRNKGARLLPSEPDPLAKYYISIAIPWLTGDAIEKGFRQMPVSNTNIDLISQTWDISSSQSMCISSNIIPIIQDRYSGIHFFIFNSRIIL